MTIIKATSGRGRTRVGCFRETRRETRPALHGPAHVFAAHELGAVEGCSSRRRLFRTPDATAEGDGWRSRRGSEKAQVVRYAPRIGARASGWSSTRRVRGIARVGLFPDTNRRDLARRSGRTHARARVDDERRQSSSKGVLRALEKRRTTFTPFEGPSVFLLRPPWRAFRSLAAPTVIPPRHDDDDEMRDANTLHPPGGSIAGTTAPSFERDRVLRRPDRRRADRREIQFADLPTSTTPSGRRTRRWSRRSRRSRVAIERTPRAIPTWPRPARASSSETQPLSLSSFSLSSSAPSRSPVPWAGC